MRRLLARLRLGAAVMALAEPEHYAAMREAGSVHPCPIGGCRLSVEEHHRLARGIIAENRELRKRVRALEGS